MLKPVDYREIFMSTRETPYAPLRVHPPGDSEGQGTLTGERVISLTESVDLRRFNLLVNHYSEECGLVRVNSRWLNRMR